jgi:hypothetical protein
MSGCAKIMNMQDVEKMMSCAMSQMRKGKSSTARMILVECLTYVKTIDQHQQISNNIRGNDIVGLEEYVQMIAVRLGRRQYEVDSMGIQCKPDSSLPDHNGLYFSAYYLSFGSRHCNIDVTTITAVLLYNIAITYHKEGLVDGRSTSYQKALYTYKNILKLTKQKTDKKENVASTVLSQAILRIIVTVCHNMGHIYRECGELVLYRRLTDIGSRVADTVNDEMMPRCDREFFALNHFFATMSDRCCAQAA